jgi:hypothetical protein
MIEGRTAIVVPSGASLSVGSRPAARTPAAADSVGIATSHHGGIGRRGTPDQSGVANRRAISGSIAETIVRVGRTTVIRVVRMTVVLVVMRVSVVARTSVGRDRMTAIGAAPPSAVGGVRMTVVLAVTKASVVARTTAVGALPTTGPVVTRVSAADRTTAIGGVRSSVGRDLMTVIGAAPPTAVLAVMKVNVAVRTTAVHVVRMTAGLGAMSPNVAVRTTAVGGVRSSVVRDLMTVIGGAPLTAVGVVRMTVVLVVMRVSAVARTTVGHGLTSVNRGTARADLAGTTAPAMTTAAVGTATPTVAAKVPVAMRIGRPGTVIAGRRSPNPTSRHARHRLSFLTTSSPAISTGRYGLSCARCRVRSPTWWPGTSWPPAGCSTMHPRRRSPTH